MERRALLRGLAALAGGGMLAGCSNNQEVPRTAPDGPVDIRSTPTSFPTTEPPDDGQNGSDDAKTTVQRFIFPEPIDVKAGTAGQLLVIIVVKNRAAVQNTGVIRPVVVVDGTEYTSGEFAKLDPGEQTTLRIVMPVSYESFSKSGSLSIEVERKTPETPLPTQTTPAGNATGSGTGTVTDGSPTGDSS